MTKIFQRVLLIAVAAMTPSWAQHVTGILGSPSATMTIDGKQSAAPRIRSSAV